MNCEDCEWYRYQLLTEDKLQTVRIQRIVSEMRKCERGWCDKEEGKKVKNGLDSDHSRRHNYCCGNSLV